MKLYRVNIYSRDLGTLWRWCGTKAEAEREAATYDESTVVERVDIPEQKQPLIAWLNKYAGDNNG